MECKVKRASSTKDKWRCVIGVQLLVLLQTGSMHQLTESGLTVCDTMIKQHDWATWSQSCCPETPTTIGGAAAAVARSYGRGVGAPSIGKRAGITGFRV